MFRTTERLELFEVDHGLDYRGPVENHVRHVELISRWLRVNLSKSLSVGPFGWNALATRQPILPVAFDLGRLLVVALCVNAPRHGSQKGGVIGSAGWFRMHGFEVSMMHSRAGQHEKTEGSQTRIGANWISGN
jgi:hypothetical protein